MFKNGDFSQPNLANWTLARGGLDGGLDASASTDPSVPGNPAGLLGNPAYPCNNGVPRGYASLSQSFIMPNVPTGKQLVLGFSYHIFTYDQQNDPMDSNHDRFEVLTNTFLIMRDMNQSQPYGCPPAPIHDLGRQDASIVVKGNPRESIKVDFRLWNDYDRSYNTYVYLDEVHLRFEERR
jgi:hypothetical protein